MKKIIIPIICALSILLVYLNLDRIINITTKFFSREQDLLILAGNEYTKDNDYLYVQRSSDYIPLSYQDLLNIFYSIINNHWDTFTFYCPKEYENCTDDVTKISDSSLVLSNINNFVHPYNSFTNIKTSVDTNGEIIVKVTYLYTKNQIDYINNEVDKIINNNVKDYLGLEQNIKNIHDYIINNTKYDTNYKNNTDKFTYTAYGALKEHEATCNGYTDLMAIILSKMNVDNYKIAYNPNNGNSVSDGHVWNAVYIDNNWLHLDLTWDDPVGEGQNYLYHKYFLVTTDEMNDADAGDVVVTEHKFDYDVYLEF